MFITLNFKGDAIGKHTACNVFLPQKQSGPLPVLYLLHGLSDDYTAWQRRTSLERYVAELPLIVVMPDGGRSFYANDQRVGGMRYEDHIMKDLIPMIDRAFHTVTRRTGRAIAGLSMGGYGATMLAMKYPQVFCAASSHSGAVGFATDAFKQRKEIQNLLQAEAAGYNLYLLSRKLKQSRKKIAYRMDCGTEDGLLGMNRDFHKHLETLNFAHEYAEFPGIHDWVYWDEHIRQTLAFVMKHVKQ